MRYVLILIFFTLMTTAAQGQIAAWDLTSTTLTATTTDTHLTASAITVFPSTPISYQAKPGDIYCGSWSTSTTFSPTGKYWQFSVKPNPGFEVTLSSLSFNAGRTATGPQFLQVQYSLDSFVTEGTTALGEMQNSNTSTSSLDQFNIIALPSSTTNEITFRIWGYGASSTGNFRLNNIAVNGTLVSVSTPGSGIGSAQISPTTLNAKQTSDFTIKIASTETDTIANVVVVVPQLFNWSMNSSDVSFTENSLSSSNLTIDHDTISITGTAITKVDTGQVVIRSLTAPDSSATVNFLVKTSIGTLLPSAMNSNLSISVIKMVRIIDLHINDSQGVPIAPYGLGATVTVSGIITADFNSNYTNIFVQDATGGVCVYRNVRSFDYAIGDSVTITGTVTQFHGLIEIGLNDTTKYILHSRGDLLPEPLLLTCADVNQTFNDDYTEPNEGRLVRLNNVTYDASDQTVADATGATGVYLGNLTIPAGTFDLIGILKQYKPGTSSTLTPPYTENYEVDPRTSDDVIIHPGPSLTESPTEDDIHPNSVTINFKTATQSVATIRYGKSSYTDSVVVSTADTGHAVTLTSLWPATVYHYQVSATDQAGTNTTGDAIFSTASPTGSTEIMDVYFNHSVDTSIATGEKAQTVDIASKFISRINAAKYSVDLALYSISGTVGNNIANAILNAKNRGVKIRMIVENDNYVGSTSMNTLMNSLRSNEIPFITDSFDPINAGNGLMHNKFAIFDFRDTSSFTDDWLWTGSWNATDPGNNDDAQNAIEIQDKALANAYTMEFNEMWGSSTDTADASHSRFGAGKVDNTPHKFNIGGTSVELYFSPSDQTTFHIYQTLSHATSSINICMLTFTRSDLAGKIVAKKVDGDKVRVVMDNNTDNGNQFNFLQANGIDVHLKGSALGTGLLHHKYAIIDAESFDSSKQNREAIVITGSHNWSNSAETSNNENTLIIHSQRTANLYLQEFKARYTEAGGIDTITVLGAKRIRGDVPAFFGLNQNFPNPFNPTTTIGYQVSIASHVILKIYDVLGRKVATLVDQKQNPGYYNVIFEGTKYASGIYFCKLIATTNNGGKFTSIKKLVLMK